MKRATVIAALALIAFVLCGAVPAMAQYEAYASANAYANILQAISIMTWSDMHFGDLVSTGSEGWVTLDPYGSLWPSGGVYVANYMGSSAATFTLSGSPYTSFYVMLPGTTTMTGTMGSTMTLDGFMSEPNMSGSFDSMGYAYLSVGGTLYVPASQPSDSYSGSFTVWVYYY